MYKNRTTPKKKNWNYLLVLIWIFPTLNFSWFARWKLVVTWNLNWCLSLFFKIRPIESDRDKSSTKIFLFLTGSGLISCLKYHGSMSNEARISLFFPLQTFISFNYSQRDDISISVKEVVCYSWKEAKNALHMMMMMMITSPQTSSGRFSR